MRFRPCIDIHNGRVKQIVGGSLRDAGDAARENFVSDLDAAWYAERYRQRGLSGGHIILLNHRDSDYYEATCDQARSALSAWPGGMQVGGGITPANAASWLEAGASHVIVTSWVFREGRIDWSRLAELEREVGPERLVLDVSCRRRRDAYLVVTDRWQKFTGEAVTRAFLDSLREHCAELLVHAVDVEGKARGVETDLARILASAEGIPVTYAGGIGSLRDLEILREAGAGRLDFTVGSALDLFGGPIPFETVAAWSPE